MTEERSVICGHEDFAVTARVGRLEDIGRFVLEVEVRCTECGEPFRFLGLPAGIAVDRPVLSIDGLEATLPIEPEGEPRLARSTTVHVPKDERLKA